MKVTFIPQPAGSFLDVYLEGDLIGCVQPMPTGVWLALIEPEELPIIAGSGRGVERFQSREDAANRLIAVWKMRKMTG